jgi:hypothetical protein
VDQAVARLLALVLSVAVCVVCIIAATDGMGRRGARVNTGLATAERYQAAQLDAPDEAGARVTTDLGRVLVAHDDDARVAAIGTLADDLGHAHVELGRVRDVQAALAVVVTIALTSERDPQAGAVAILDRYAAATPIATR